MKVFLTVLLGISTLFAQAISQSASKPKVDAQLQMKKQNRQIVKLAAEELSRDLPKTVDLYTTFTKIQAQDLTLLYTFEINTGAKSDNAVRQNDRERMSQGVLYGVCRTSKRFLDSDITIAYRYLSAASKAELFTFEINRNMCESIWNTK